jgi:transcription-repair coupling factor (superfamily II helicase)
VLRLDILRDMARLDSEQGLTNFTAELEDRFGAPPEEVTNLLLVIRLKNLASAIGIERLTYNRLKHTFTLGFFEDEVDWYKRATLLDSRLGLGGPQALELALPFEGNASAMELADILLGLQALRS